MLLGDLLQKLWRGYRLARRDERLDHRLSDLGDSKALRSQRVDELLRGGFLRRVVR
jgi:hypothetical protein